MSEFLPSGLKVGPDELAIDVQLDYSAHLRSEGFSFLPETPPVGQLALAAVIDVNPVDRPAETVTTGQLWLIDLRSAPIGQLHGTSWRVMGNEFINESARYYLIDPWTHKRNEKLGFKALRRDEDFMFGRVDLTALDSRQYNSIGKRIRFDYLDDSVDFDHFRIEVADGDQVMVADTASHNGTRLFAGQKLLSHLGIARPVRQ